MKSLVQSPVSPQIQFLSACKKRKERKEKCTPTCAGTVFDLYHKSSNLRLVAYLKPQTLTKIRYMTIGTHGK